MAILSQPQFSMAMHSAWKILTALLPLLEAACETPQMQSQNGWLADAPQYSQDSASGGDQSELADVGSAHSHSGHR